MLRVKLALIGAAVAAFAVVGTAAAAPTNAKNAETLDLECDNGETYEIVLNGNGEWTPGHLLDGGVLIPVSFDFVGTFTDADGNEFPVDESSTKGNGKAGQNKELLTCTFGIFFEDPETGETFDAVGTVQGFVPGKPAS